MIPKRMWVLKMIEQEDCVEKIFNGDFPYRIVKGKSD